MIRRGGKVWVVVASTNPVKLDATDAGFRRLGLDRGVVVSACSVPSGVADQPRSDVETRRGAENRAVAAQDFEPDADFWVGVEGGVADNGVEGEMEAFAWVVVRSADGVGRSRTSSFVLPPAVTELVRRGHDLGYADDVVFGRTNSKQHEGAVGLLTDGAIDRRGLYEPSIVLALAPLLKPELYSAGR